MTAVTELLRAILSFLRYLAAPLVAVVVVALSDEGHCATQATISALSAIDHSQTLWLAGAFIVILGVLSYYLHRIVVHPIVTKLVVWLASCRLGIPATVDDLAFARWERRQDQAPGRLAQVALDELNTSVHFFYSSAVASLLLAAAINRVVQEFVLNPCIFATLVILLMAVALWGDYQAARFDIQAHKRYKGKEAS